jgi:hypothetical protein
MIIGYLSAPCWNVENNAEIEEWVKMDMQFMAKTTPPFNMLDGCQPCGVDAVTIKAFDVI